MSCSLLLRDRVDPLVEPGVIGTSHLHQIVGGNSFRANMTPITHDPATESACTTCTLPDDFSNYWTATMFYQSPHNGSYKRIKQIGSLFHEKAREGGITIYYFPQYMDLDGRSTNKVRLRAFAPGFRMRTGHPNNNQQYPGTPWRDPSATRTLMDGIVYTCLQREDTRFTHLGYEFPGVPCPEGILTTIFFPPCWDGKNLDSPDHSSHVAYVMDGDYMRGAACPASHPVIIPQIALEIRWDTREFNAEEFWPVTKGRQPFLWSFGDRKGFGHHGDYLFGWKGDSLQKAFDCVGCGAQGGLPGQSIEAANECRGTPQVEEDVDGWLETMPGGVVGRAWE
ncbi:hypothetical protein OQA88_8040 [Cercophora sp. LCS_1]